MNNEKVMEKSLIADYLKDYEYYSFEKTDLRSYAERNLKRAEKLWELHPEQQLYHLMQAAVLIRVGKKEEAEKILKKYEKF